MSKDDVNANSFFDGGHAAVGEEIEHDPLSQRKTHFTMKVNEYEMELMQRCADIQRVGKAALLRHLLDEYAKEKGIF